MINLFSSCADDLLSRGIPPAEAGGSFKPSLQTRNLLSNPTSGRRLYTSRWKPFGINKGVKSRHLPSPLFAAFGDLCTASGSWWIVQTQPTNSQPFLKSHQRKLVDCSNPAYKLATFSQIPPAEAGGLFKPSLQQQQSKVGLEQSTSFRWWDSLNLAFRCRSGLNDPPASAGGIQPIRTGRLFFYRTGLQHKA